MIEEPVRQYSIWWAPAPSPWIPSPDWVPPTPIPEHWTWPHPIPRPWPWPPPGPLHYPGAVTPYYSQSLGWGNTCFENCMRRTGGNLDFCRSMCRPPLM